MKKGSTAATMQSRNFSAQQKLTIGLDLGDRNSWYCVLDEAGQIQLEQRVRTNAKALQAVFGAMALGSGWRGFERYRLVTTAKKLPRLSLTISWRRLRRVSLIRGQPVPRPSSKPTSEKTEQ